MRKKRIRIGILSGVLLLIILVSGSAIYISDYYRADDIAIEAFSEQISVVETELDGVITYGTGQEDMAFIFYPGGKVEHTSYEPLMRAIAEKGIFCLLVEMPFNLAVLDMDAAEDIREQFPDIEYWYIGGHSLGGSMAASHLGDHVGEYEGLVLLGAYSTENLSDTDLDVLSVYGSEDKVMNREKYDKYLPNLPQDFTETVISGGCHAYFGMYGEQDGDGEPTLTEDEQILITADTIYQFMRENKKYD